jgi:20S proteasome subunit alpha 2
MDHSEARYGLTTFSPSGELVQIKYAQQAVLKGATSLGIVAENGVVIAAEKKTPTPLIDPSTVQKVFELDEHVGCVYSGLGPDSRLLVDEARKECQVYRKTYQESMPVLQLVKAIASVYQEYTQSGGVRPFGVSLLVCGVDNTGFHLYQLDPSGTFLAWKAVAIGRNHSSAKSTLEKRFQEDATIEEAINTALIVLKDGMDGKMTTGNIEVGYVEVDPATKIPRFRIMTADRLADHLDQAI